MGGKMRIGIEGKVLTRHIGGIGRYAINLLQSMLTIAATERPNLEFVIFSAPQTDPAILRSFKATSCHHFRSVKSSLLRSSLLLPAGVVIEGLDLFHGLDQSGIPFFFKRGKCVVTLHDILPCVLPWAFPRSHRLVSRFAFSRVCQQADIILVPSNAVKTDVLEYFHIDEHRIVVIPLGCEEHFRPMGDPAQAEAVRKRYQLPECYMLFLGTLEPRKDVVTLLQAFALMRAKQLEADIKLVIAGGHGWGHPEALNTCNSLRLGDAVVFTGFVDEDDLPDLYRGAQLFVYPSLSEGFGLPIVEAMACGVPVITSNVSSMPEVAGQAALLVEPKQPEALAATMASVLCDEPLRHHLREKGLERARCFSWQDVARRTLDVYTTLL
jgi:glycosyltransferase involved in cell wall biosynthesis